MPGRGSEHIGGTQRLSPQRDPDHPARSRRARRAKPVRVPSTASSLFGDLLACRLSCHRLGQERCRRQGGVQVHVPQLPNTIPVRARRSCSGRRRGGSPPCRLRSPTARSASPVTSSERWEACSQDDGRCGTCPRHERPHPPRGGRRDERYEFKTTIQNKNSKRMKKGNVHENVQANVGHQEQWYLSVLRRLHLSRFDRRVRRPDRELFSGDPAAPGQSGTQQLDALSAHV